MIVYTVLKINTTITTMDTESQSQLIEERETVKYNAYCNIITHKPQ